MRPLACDLCRSVALRQQDVSSHGLQARHLSRNAVNTPCAATLAPPLTHSSSVQGHRMPQPPCAVWSHA